MTFGSKNSPSFFQIWIFKTKLNLTKVSMYGNNNKIFCIWPIIPFFFCELTISPEEFSWNFCRLPNRFLSIIFCQHFGHFPAQPRQCMQRQCQITPIPFRVWKQILPFSVVICWVKHQSQLEFARLAAEFDDANNKFHKLLGFGLISSGNRFCGGRLLWWIYKLGEEFGFFKYQKICKPLNFCGSKFPDANSPIK